MQKTAGKRSTALIKRPASFAEWVSDIAQDKSFGRVLSARGFAFGLLIILLVAMLTYASLAYFWGKFSRAEVFFAECAREMLVSSNFITPLYHDQPFFDKPIFVYWLIIAMFKAFGVNHFAARIPSILASLITIFSTAFAANYLFGRRAGLIAAAILASSFMYLSFSYLCMSDMFLIMFDTLSLIFVYAGTRFANKRTQYWQMAAISMGLAFLTKGPVGVVLPAAASVIYLTITKQIHMIRLNHVIWASIFISVIASPWFYAAYQANGVSALTHFFIQENLQRFAGDTYDVHKPFWYTIFSFFLGFAPWSILFPSAFMWFGKNLYQVSNEIAKPVKVSDDFGYESIQFKDSLRPTLRSFSLLPLELSAELFLWIWLFVAVGFFCFSRGKCDYYTLPAYPAAAILLSQYICNCLQKYQNLVKGLAFVIALITITFASLALPKIACLVPVNKYAAIIREFSDRLPAKNVRLGVDISLSSWIDEILFQSGKDATCLGSMQQINSFVGQDGPFLLFIPEDKYNSLSLRQTNKWRILTCDKVATHSLTPGYLISRGGNIVDPAGLVVATNIREHR